MGITVRNDCNMETWNINSKQTSQFRRRVSPDHYYNKTIIWDFNMEPLSNLQFMFWLKKIFLDLLCQSSAVWSCSKVYVDILESIIYCY